MRCYLYFILLPLDISCGECNVISLYFLCCSVNGCVCRVCCVFDSVCDQTIRNFFWAWLLF